MFLNISAYFGQIIQSFLQLTCPMKFRFLFQWKPGALAPTPKFEFLETSQVIHHFSCRRSSAIRTDYCNVSCRSGAMDWVKVSGLVGGLGASLRSPLVARLLLSSCVLPVKPFLANVLIVYIAIPKKLSMKCSRYHAMLIHLALGVDTLTAFNLHFSLSLRCLFWLRMFRCCIYYCCFFCLCLCETINNMCSFNFFVFLSRGFLPALIGRMLCVCPSKASP